MRSFQNLNAKVVLRCDLAVLFVPIALYGFTYGRFRLLPTAKTVVTSALTALGAMVSIFFDCNSCHSAAGLSPLGTCPVARGDCLFLQYRAKWERRIRSLLAIVNA
jgi:hypothetical protein